MASNSLFSDQEIQQAGSAVPSSQTSAENTLPENGGLFSPDEISKASMPNAGNEQAGQQTNDVGNTIIVPKEGESFADTMHRAAAFGKTVTQSDINKEMATAPKKVAETLAAAPVLGAAGAGLLTVPGELSALGSQTFQAARALIQAHPEAAKVIGKMLVTGALGGDIGHSAKSAILGALLGGLIK